MSEGPLAGLNVVELTVHRAGPFCGALLADMGADVVKIERPDVGDAARWEGPGPDGKAAYFMANNRNKKSVTLDLKTDAGTEAAHELLADADVFIENFGHGVADKLGVGYETVRSLNEDLVYASVKGYGETGPYKEKKGLDLILQAEGGIMSVTGPEGGDPVKVGQAIGDLGAGMYAALGILARLYERGSVGSTDEFVGKFDISLFDTIVAYMNEYITLYSMTGNVPEPQGTSHQTSVPYQLFDTSDGRIVTGVPSDERWDDFVDMLGRDEIREYRTNEARVENREEVIGAIQDEFANDTTDHWMEQLTEYGFPNGPVNDIEDVVSHDQTAARGLAEEHTDPEWGDCLMPGHPIHFPNHDVSIKSPAPSLGEHTDEVFETVADDQSTLDRWTEEGAFGSST
ncbi:CaiB/BaiF CoA transferase family protein [Halorussus salinisoli]|uniref:CaiB/BaiF CoA transferase family protein n=1 Tax=Halorussus salinisoli TaxID=2558242 RepID=UPI0010C1E706|nr:CaiB/BaiF CoA-transferase family protein [Halorussus salinisoli]